MKIISVNLVSVLKNLNYYKKSQEIALVHGNAHVRIYISYKNSMHDLL